MKTKKKTSSSLRLRRRRCRAFTLVEAMFSCMLMVFGFVPILAVLAMSHRVEQQAQVRQVAYNVARYELEQLTAHSWTDIGVTSDTAFSAPAVLTGQIPYSVVLTGKYNIAATGAANLRQITVLVTWKNVSQATGANGAVSEIRLSTLVAQQPYQANQ